MFNITASHHHQPANLLATFRSYAAAFLITAGSWLPGSAVAETYLHLPEPRYIQDGVEYKTVETKQFAIPVIKDRWDEMATERAVQLHDLLGQTSSCDTISVSKNWMSCSNRYRGRCLKEGTKTEWVDDFIGSNVGEPPRQRIVQVETCEEYEQGDRTEFSVSYRELSDITTSSPILGFGGNNLCFCDKEGKTHEIDTNSREDARSAAGLLRDLRHLDQAMQNKAANDSLKVAAVLVERDYHTVKREAENRYRAADGSEEYYKEMIQCILGISPALSRPLESKSKSSGGIIINPVSAQIEMCIQKGIRGIINIYESLGVGIKPQEIRDELENRLNAVTDAQKYLRQGRRKK